MWNCVRVAINGRPVAYFATMDAADAYRRIFMQAYTHLNPVVHCDWAYVEGLVF